MDILQIIFLSLIGLLTGFLSGLLGIGGGSIRIPLLYLIGFPMISAYAINLFTIPFSSFSGSYIQRKNIRLDVFKPTLIGAILGLIISSILVGFISNKFLIIIFIIVVVITVLGLYLEEINSYVYGLIKPNKKILFLSGFFVNFIIGLRGGSGGTLFPSVLKSLHLRMHEAIATSLLIGGFSAILGALIYIFRGDLIFIPAIITLTTSLIGVYFGSLLSLKTRSKYLKFILATLTIGLSLILVFKEFL
jgi:uncharacterized protein